MEEYDIPPNASVIFTPMIRQSAPTNSTVGGGMHPSSSNSSSLPFSNSNSSPSIQPGQSNFVSPPFDMMADLGGSNPQQRASLSGRHRGSAAASSVITPKNGNPNSSISVPANLYPTTSSNLTDDHTNNYMDAYPGAAATGSTPTGTSRAIVPPLQLKLHSIGGAAARYNELPGSSETPTVPLSQQQLHAHTQQGRPERQHPTTPVPNSGSEYDSLGLGTQQERFRVVEGGGGLAVPPADPCGDDDSDNPFTLTPRSGESPRKRKIKPNKHASIDTQPPTNITAQKNYIQHKDCPRRQIGYGYGDRSAVGER
eukprot:TRINITY_DN58027_c0_g1_i1.p1 TRINITY_DN58027_c0_g1~~TRINITY_DN58027_c0_g1_i1.p1  ORF type:complete len:365 (+),score=38.19 TRINITY_DN58027_c0_g1_i1:162-1097(+)